MKIKFLPLFLVITGIIMISGCVDLEKQPLTSKTSGDLYRSIFYPYFGLLHHRNPQIPDGEPLASFPSHPKPESMHNLNDATSLLDRNIQKANVTLIRLEAGIQRQKAEGKNVSKVEALLEKYKLLVEEAKKYRALADKAIAEENNSSLSYSGLDNSSSENLKREYLIESQKNMIQANYILKEIFKELQHLMPGNEELNSTAHLSAAGEGMVSLMGSLTLNLHMEEGEVAVPRLSPDSEIQINGDYTLEKKTGRNEIEREMLLYYIHSADVKISGSHKAVMLKGKNIILTTDGEGYAAFLGNGTYSIEYAEGIKKGQNWAHPLFIEGTNPDEMGPSGPAEYKPDGKKQEFSDSGRRRRNNITEAFRIEGSKVDLIN